jgi:ABC-type ATPase with predicted acetyltransferase domain
VQGADRVKVEIEVKSKIERTPRVMQMEGMFDVPRAAASELRWTADLPIEDRPWNVGLILGPSGCGKSTLARRLFPEQLARTFQWSGEKSLLDGFPAAMGVKDIIEVLSSVGFSSPPAWLRPFHVLSNGEQFRVGLARLLAESPELAVVDEFSSVVDRTVAQIGSAALAKTVRRRGQRFVAVTCHEDVEEWLQPDWIFRPASRGGSFNAVRRSSSRSSAFITARGGSSATITI